MQMLDLYVGEDIRRLECERRVPAAQHTLAWLEAQRAHRRAVRHAALLWLGDHFVLVGERLRAWSSAGEVRVSASRG